MNSLVYLFSTLFDLYIMVVLLRIWLQVARADFYNPFSQFIVKITQPVVGPLRRLIPSIGALDVATLLFAYVLCVLKFIVVTYVGVGSVVFDIGFLYIGLLALIKAAGNLLFWVLILRAIMSWVSQGRSPVEYVFHQLTDPLLSPIRRILPSTGMFDFSVMVLFIILYFINMLIGDILGPMWFQI